MALAPSIILEKINLIYDDAFIFKNFNATFIGGKITCILGKSGVGKTRLLRIIAGLESYTGKVASEKSEEINQHIAFLTQDDGLLPWLSILQNTTLGYHLRKKLNDKILTQATKLLELANLSANIHHKPTTLSAGMKQRAALIRTIVENKKILLLDEPFSKLDVITKHQLINDMAGLLQDKTIIYVSHDPLETLRLADYIYVLYDRPAVLSERIELTSPKPRDIGDPELVILERKLWRLLEI